MTRTSQNRGRAVAVPLRKSPWWRRGSWSVLPLLLASAFWAAPAPWYYWRSKIDGKRVCAQTSPGPGWEQDSDAYDGPLCQPRARVFVIPAS